MYNVTAYLTIKNKTFYTVLTYYVDDKRKLKWVSTGIKEHESKKKALMTTFISSLRKKLKRNLFKLEMNL